MPPIKHLKLLDIGCGEGKDAVFFARNGYDVTAFDISDAGIEKTKRLADKIGVHVDVFKADILDYRLDTYFDVIYSSVVLNYIKPDYRDELYHPHPKRKQMHLSGTLVNYLPIITIG